MQARFGRLANVLVAGAELPFGCRKNAIVASASFDAALYSCHVFFSFEPVGGGLLITL